MHVKYLEWLSIDRATTAARYTLDNGNAGGRPFIPEALEADVLDAYETASTLLATLGYPVFEPPAGSTEEPVEREIFYCKGKHADGQGAMMDDGFALLKGSVCRAEPVPSAQKYKANILGLIDELSESGVVVPHGEQQLLLTEDYLCNSPSFAANLVLGRSANGWTNWKNKDGQTLDELFRSPST